MPTIEEAMEEAQSSMQQMIDERAAQAERANKLQMFLIGDFYEIAAPEKIKNLKALHDA